MRLGGLHNICATSCIYIDISCHYNKDISIVLYCIDENEKADGDDVDDAAANAAVAAADDEMMKLLLLLMMMINIVITDFIITHRVMAITSIPSC